jgi:hypothetical protein
MDNERIIFSQFIYDNRRICSKIYVSLKFMGLIFYSTLLLSCYKPDFYIGIIVIMFLSTMNCARYEYAHFKRYGTIFSSFNEYQLWKRNLYPNSRLFFSMIELSIKIVYFIRNFPPQFDFRNLCEIGQSVFNLHILLLFIVYFISSIFSIFLFCTIHCNNYFFPRPVRHLMPVSLQIPIFAIDYQTDECCICLDIDNTRQWSILECGHKFHNLCILTWIHTNQTCPVCRHSVIPVS